MKKNIIILYILMFLLLNISTQDNSNDILLNQGVKDISFLSNLEIEVIKEINLARTNPKLYAQLLTDFKKYYKGNYLEIPGEIPLITEEGLKAVQEAINFLNNVKAIQPLKLSYGLSMAAKIHMEDQSKKGSTGHTGSNGSSPFQRMNNFGKWTNTAGENIDYGNNIARRIVFSLIIDDGVPGRGHRENIFNKEFNVVGVSCGPHKVYSYMCVIDFAGGYIEKNN